MSEMVLFADDEAGIRAVMAIVLADAGLTPLMAADGREALELFKRHRPGLVITDIRMPGLDGIGLLTAVKTIDPDVEVIMTTGHGDMKLAIESLRLGASDFLTKPIDDALLGFSLARAGEKRDLKRRLAAYTGRLEQLVEEKTRRLIRAERMAAVGQTVTEMSHAIKNMAGGLEASMYVMEKGLECNNREYLTQSWDMIRCDVARLKNLALNLLDYAKPVTLHPRPIDANEPAREALRLIGATAGSAGVALASELAPDIGQAVLDPEAVHACLLNFLQNAVEAFEGADRPDRRVVLTTRAEGDALVYAVRDFGPGIPAAVREQLFSAFFTTKGSRGTGIGLMSARKLAEEMGGTLAVDAPAGGGARFSLRLPRAPHPDRPADTATHPAES